MPVAPTIFDPNASPTLTAVSKIGLPWMTEETNSPGPGSRGSSSTASTSGAALRYPAARIAPTRNTPTRRGKPSYKAEWYCAFSSVLTGEPRKSESSKESGWGLTSARNRPFAAGNLCQRMMGRATPCQPGSPPKRSSACSRQFFCNGIAFF